MTAGNRIVCPACSALNRVPQGKSAAAGRCGKCGSPLMTGAPIEVSAATFERHTRRGDLPVLVDVWAPWCGPCRMMAPAFEAAAGELEPEVRLLKLNSEAEPGLSSQLGIRSIPTLLLYAHGREVSRVAGAIGKNQIVAWARSRLAEAA